MNTLFVFLFAITSILTTPLTQEKETVKATFVEYTDGIYYFQDKDDYYIEFEYVEKEVLTKFNLSLEEFKGKIFIITYQPNEEKDEDGDMVTVNTIIEMKLAE